MRNGSQSKAGKHSYFYLEIRAAATAAPFVHPRLHSIDAKVETAVIVMTEDERRRQAQELIREAKR
jgi:hypothetical protein